MASYSDDFNRASLGANWAAVNGGTWAIDASTYVSQAASGGAYRVLRYSGALDSDDVDVTIRVRSANGVGAGIVVRVPGSGTTSTSVDGYAILSFPGDAFYIVRMDNGDDSGVGYGYAWGAPTANTWYTLRIVVDGSTITGYVNGTERFSFTDSTYSGSGNRSVGLLSYSTTPLYDDFAAADISSGGSTYNLVANILATSTTPDTAGAAAARPLLAAILAASATAENVTASTASEISFAAVIAALSATPDTTPSVVARPLAGNAQAASATPDSASGVISRTFTAFPALTSVTPSGSGEGADYALRFYGNATGQIDRARIELDNPSDPPIDVGAGDFAYEFWMRAAYADNTSTDSQDARDSNIILDRDIWGHERGWVLGVTRRSGSRLCVCFGVAGASTTWPTIYGETNIGDNEWHHIALVRRVSDGFTQIFVDGVEDVTGTYTGNLSYPNGVNPGSGQDNPYLVIGTEKHDVGAGYNGYFNKFRVSNSRRYTTTFTPPTTLDADANTMALFQFDEGTGTVAYDSSGQTGAENAELLVGGSPSGPTWELIALGDDGVYGTVARSIAPNVAATSTTPDIATVIARPVVGNAAAASVTPDVATVVVRSFLANVQATLVTPDDVTVTLARALVANAGATSATPDTAAAQVARVLLAAVSVTSVTPSPATSVQRRYVVAVNAVSVTGDAEATLAAIVSFLAMVAAESATAEDAGASVARSVVSSTETVSTTADIVATVARQILANAAAASVTGDITGLLASMIELSAQIAATSDAPDTVAASVARSLAASVAAGSDAALITAAVARAILANAVAASVTGDIAGAVLSVVNLVASIIAESSTPDATALMARGLAADVQTGSATGDALASIERTLVALISPETVTPDIDTTIVLQAAIRYVTLSAQARKPSVTATGRRPGIVVPD